MVIQNEAVDLDPAPEDILSVWGKEVNAQNIDKFFGQVGSHASANFSVGGSWSNKASKGLLEESLELAGLLGNSGRDPRESGSQEKECALKENPYGTLGGKVLSPSKVFCPSGGLERDLEICGGWSKLRK